MIPYKRIRLIRAVIFSALCGAALFTSIHQLQASEEPAGGFRLDYWTYGADGNATVHGSEADINSTDKVLKGQNWGMVLLGDILFDNWGLNMDLFWGHQSDTKQISSSQSADWSAEFSILTIGAFLPLVDHEFGSSDEKIRIDGILGVRSNSHNYDIEFEPFDSSNNMNRSDYVAWIDPYLGLRLEGKFSPKWAINLYGDAGGFSIGNASKLSVLTHADLVWTVTEGFNIVGGYRLFDFETASENGAHKTELDMRMAGPTLGLECRF